MTTYTDPERMEEAILDLDEGERITITTDDTDHIKAEVGLVQSNPENPNADWVLVAYVENWLYGVASRPNQNNAYDIEVCRVKQEDIDLRIDHVRNQSSSNALWDEAAEYLGNLTRLQIH